MSGDQSFGALRNRAFELADTGQFIGLDEVAAVMEKEGYALASKRLNADPILRHMVKARCEQAKARL